MISIILVTKKKIFTFVRERIILYNSVLRKMFQFHFIYKKIIFTNFYLKKMILRLTISQFHFIYKRMTYIKNDFYNFTYKKKKKSFNPIFIYKKTPFTIFI